MTRRSKPSRASSGTTRKRPATRERSERPGARFSSRQSATSGGSGRGRSWLGHDPGGRPRPSARKRGRDAATTIGTETTDHRSQRRELVAEPLGDPIERLGIHEDRTEGFVSALEGLRWLEEEPAGMASLHDAGSRMLIIFWPGTSAERTPKNRSEKGSWPPSMHVGLMKGRENASQSSKQS